VTPTTSGSSAAAPVKPTTPPATWTGDLQEPDDASATQIFAGAGPTEVSATWTPGLTLSLTVTCPGGTQAAQGSSEVGVVIADATGACEITLKETVVQYDAIAYTLTIGPADGG
jgi:hypothetical protein